MPSAFTHPALIVFACGVSAGALAAYAATALKYEHTLLSMNSTVRALKWQVGTINNMLITSKQGERSANEQVAALQAKLDELAAQAEVANISTEPQTKAAQIARPQRPAREIWLSAQRQIASSAPKSTGSLRPATTTATPTLTSTRKADPEPGRLSSSAPASAPGKPAVVEFAPSAPAAAPNLAAASAPTITATLTKLKIAGLDTRGVLLKNGSTIAINQTFPSGEKLIAVDPATNKIVTDQRVISVIGP